MIGLSDKAKATLHNKVVPFLVGLTLGLFLVAMAVFSLGGKCG